MFSTDFVYDGDNLSDYGFIICDFNFSDGETEVSAGSQIKFNTVPRYSGKVFSLTSTEYDECISLSFDICKNPDIYDYAQREISENEYRNIMRWLNRREFLEFYLIHDDVNDINRNSATVYFNASFNIEKITIGEKLYGFRLNMETDKPFGYGTEIVNTLTFSNSNSTLSLIDNSDEIGYIYPSLSIQINQAGNLSLYNSLEDCNMIINNCSVGEVITIDGKTQIISSSLNSHKIYDDFNFEFLRIGNTFNNRSNPITSSLRCVVEVSYYPIIKIAP